MIIIVFLLLIASIMPYHSCGSHQTLLEQPCSRADVGAPMPPTTEEVDQVSPGIFVWQAYDSKIKAYLFSTVLKPPAGLYVVDPIPLGPDGLLSLRSYGKAAGIFVTNGN